MTNQLEYIVYKNRWQDVCVMWNFYDLPFLLTSMVGCVELWAKQKQTKVLQLLDGVSE